ncbi:MAG: DUF1080 domain-containing protein [Tepidisphaerales bacterium]
MMIRPMHAVVLLAVLCLNAGTAMADEELVLFNGKDLTGWKLRTADRTDTYKVVADVKLDQADRGKLIGAGEGAEGRGIMFRQPVAHGSDIISEKTFGDCEIHVELMVAKGSNSGIYLMGQYEVQVLDSFGIPDDKINAGDNGAIYGATKPAKNASKAPGEWQTYDIVFQAPRFDAAGKKTANARAISVTLNGVEIHKDVEIKGPTGGQLPGGEKATGPLMLQGDHGIVAFRNIRVKIKN